MPSPARVDLTPSGDEQRHITLIVRNIRRLAAWRLKKAAREYAAVHTGRRPATVLLSEAPIHGR